MALQGTDLLVVQSQSDSQLYKLKIETLDTYLEGSSGIQFKGEVDLNNGAANQPDPITLPASNGDLYIVKEDCAQINADWIMQEGVTSATKNDRVIWESGSGYWVLVEGGSSTGGLIETITVTTPLQSDNDTTNPVITIDAATETQAGYVARLANATDVHHSTGSGDSDAVVTADLLKATNKLVEDLSVSGGAVTSVSTTNAQGNSALTISPTSGNVVIELDTAANDGSSYGVVQVATPSAIQSGTAGASAVVDAAQLKAVSDTIPAAGIQSLSEGGSDVVSGALEISSSSAATIGVKTETFVPFDFSALPDIA